MPGLRDICRMYGGMRVSGATETIDYVWDYVADEPVPDTDMPIGSKRWKASERRKYELVQEQRLAEARRAVTTPETSHDDQ